MTAQTTVNKTNKARTGSSNYQKRDLQNTAERSSGATNKIQEGVSDLASEASHVLQLGKKLGEEKVEEGVEFAKLYGEKTLGDLKEIVSRKPLQSLGIAVAAGALFGALWSRKG